MVDIGSVVMVEGPGLTLRPALVVDAYARELPHPVLTVVYVVTVQQNATQRTVNESVIRHAVVCNEDRPEMPWRWWPTAQPTLAAPPAGN